MANKYDNMTLEDLINKRDKAAKVSKIAGITAGVSIGTGRGSKMIGTIDRAYDGFRKSAGIEESRSPISNLLSKSVQPISTASKVATLGGIPVAVASNIRKNKIQKAIDNKLRSEVLPKLKSISSDSSVSMYDMTDDQLEAVADRAKTRSRVNRMAALTHAGLGTANILGVYAADQGKSRMGRELRNSKMFRDFVGPATALNTISAIGHAGSAKTAEIEARRADQILTARHRDPSRLDKATPDKIADDSFESIM